MIRPKSELQIKTLREGGRRHANILSSLADMCVPGASSIEIENQAQKLCLDHQVVPAFLNYQPEGASSPFPAALCFSVNDEIVHGIPNIIDKVLKTGDIVTLDLGIIYEGLITDAAITVGVGNISDENKRLIQTAWDSLEVGIKEAVANAPVSNIGAAIERTVQKSGNYAIYRGLVGHGVGFEVHEDPNIPNFNTRERLPVLPLGAVIAIEPMIGRGGAKFVLDTDDWTYKTSDGSIAVHVEHTVAVTVDGPLVLTCE